MLDKIFRSEKAMKHAKDENDHYPAIYERWFQHKRFDIRHFLEIGVHKGGALRAWSRYFPGAEIYGVDIKDRLDTSKTYNNCKIKVEFGDATDGSFMRKTFSNIDFDIIIDDASHMVEHQLETFSIMFQRVKPGGVYVVEDTHSSYWPEFNGGYGTGNFIDKTKVFADYVNYRAYKISERAGELKVKEVPTWLEKNICSVSYFRGLCFIERTK